MLAIDHLHRKTIKNLFRRICVDRATGCWNWTGGTDGHYGIAYVNGADHRVHRVMYAWLVEPIPAGIAARKHAQIDHIVCNNKLCCNPAHLALVTQRANCLRNTGPSAINARKTHCKNGHPLGTAREVHGSYRRDCKICDSERKKRRLTGPKAEHFREMYRRNAMRSYYLKKARMQAAQP